MSELAFPPIIEPAAAPTPVAVVDTKSADLAKLDLTAVALAQYGPWSGEIAAVKANLSTLVLDLSTPSKIKEARTLRARLIGEPLAAARKVSQGIKSKMAQTSKAVGAELEKIEAGYAEADGLILPKIEGAEAEFEREREAKAKIERERIERHRATIARIRAYAVKADSEDGMTASRVATAIQQIEALPTPTRETFEEFAIEAADAIFWTLERLRITHARLQRAEQAEAEAAELRARLAAQTKMDALPAGPAGDGSQKPNGDALGSGIAPARAGNEHTPQGANRDASAEQSHVAEGSASPSGRGADGPTACSAAPVSFPSSERISMGVIERGAAAIDAGITAYGGSPELAAAFASIERLELAPVIRRPDQIIMIESPADEKPTLKLSDICDRIAPLKIDAAGLERLGFPAAATDRAAKLYRASDWSRIKAAMIDHLKGLA